MVSTELLAVMCALLLRAVISSTSWCILHRFRLYFHRNVLGETGWRGRGLEDVNSLLVGDCVHTLLLEECFHRGKELVSMKQALAMEFCSSAKLKELVNVLVKLLKKSKCPNLIEDDMFHRIVHNSTYLTLGSEVCSSDNGSKAWSKRSGATSSVFATYFLASFAIRSSSAVVI